MKKICTLLKTPSVIGITVATLLALGSVTAYYLIAEKGRIESGAKYQVVGKILQVPESPDPAATDYADCMGVAVVEVLGVIGDSPLPKTVLVAFPLFKDRRLLEAAYYHSGDRLEISLLGSEQVGEDLASMQRIDEVDNFALPLYFATAAQPWVPGSRGSVNPPRDQKESAHVQFRDSRSDAVKRSRRAAIKADIAHIDHLLSAHGNSWGTWVDSVTPWRTKLEQQVPPSTEGILQDGLFFQRLRHTHYQKVIDTKAEAPSLRMIRALHAELDSRGIDFLVVPFPFKEEIFADAFLPGGPTDGVFVPERLQLIQQLLESDIEVLDLTAALQAAGERNSLYYPYEDPHPADGAIQIAAKEIAERLKRYQCPPQLHHLKYRISAFTMPEEFQQRRGRELKFFPDNPTFTAKVVIDNSGDLLPTGSLSSPYLLLGDSFTRCPSLYKIYGANIKDHIALNCGIIPATISVNGSAGQSMRNLAREGAAFLDARKVVILMFYSARLFPSQTEDGERERQWEIVPLSSFSTGQ